jgi:hypothetical protein
MNPQHVPDSQQERDTLAMLRLREVMPKGWTIEARGPILYRHGVVNWEVEACDTNHAHCERGYGSSLADAAERCWETVARADRR